MNLGPYSPNTYVVGDCRELLRALPDESINCVVTSPPYYGLRSYLDKNNPAKRLELGQERTPERYVTTLVEVFREVRRVLRSDGTVWLNLADTFCSNGGHSDTKCNDRRGRYNIGNVPQHEYREFRCKPGGLFKAKDLMLLPARVSIALHADGWWVRSKIIWHKPNPMVSSTKDRPTCSYEELLLLSRSERYYYDADAIREPCVMKPQRLPNGRARDETPRPGQPRQAWSTAARETLGIDGNPLGRNKRDVWTIVPEQSGEEHYAMFPRKLVEPCILAGCPAGGICLDPFAGSGTVGRVAEDLGRQWLLFDLSAKYAEIAKRKTAQTGILGMLRT